MALKDNFMSRNEKIAKGELIKQLAIEGYKTYGELLSLFDVKIPEGDEIKNFNHIGYMEPGKARITLNPTLDINQASFIVRHEILHEYLDHHHRLLRKLANEANLDYDKLDDLSLNELKQKLYSNQLANFAGDLEIANKGYTDADKRIARSIKIVNQLTGETEIVSGLVTEDINPEWVNLSLEELYDKLREDPEKYMPKGNGQQMLPPDDFDLGQSLNNPSQDSGGDMGDMGADDDPNDYEIDHVIIKGTFKDGKFYDLNGNEVTH